MHRRQACLFVLAGLLPSMPGAAASPQALSAADAVAIRDIIERQLAAFRRDDGEAAFAFASPGIRAMFGTPGAFLSMVRRAYRPVYRPREVEFRDLVDVDGRPTQRVVLVGPDGDVVVAHYRLERQADGTWRIDGCILAGSSESVT